MVELLSGNIMKQAHIKTGKVEMLVVDLLDGKSFSEIKICCETYYTATETTQYSNSITDVCISMSSKEWNYLGKATESNEEDWKGIVGQSIHTNLYPHYVEGITPPNLYCYDTATESGLSLLKANGILLENELGKYPESKKYEFTSIYERAVTEWQESESKVWRNCHVFIKMKVII